MNKERYNPKNFPRKQKKKYKKDPYNYVKIRLFNEMRKFLNRRNNSKTHNEIEKEVENIFIPVEPPKFIHVGIILKDENKANNQRPIFPV